MKANNHIKLIKLSSSSKESENNIHTQYEVYGFLRDDVVEGKPVVIDRYKSTLHGNEEVGGIFTTSTVRSIDCVAGIIRTQNSQYLLEHIHNERENNIESDLLFDYDLSDISILIRSWTLKS